MLDDDVEERRAREDAVRLRIEVNRALMDDDYERCLMLIADLMAKSSVLLSEATRARLLKAFEQDRVH
ncbi:hypothetical protein [Mesorhizobium sp. CAU 1732]|uniref:hypothetical protein n=1 Tax=Mesorhizobium sp. CAU 1732 TaxID=3140358 RepID=UPI003260D771